MDFTTLPWTDLSNLLFGQTGVITAAAPTLFAILIGVVAFKAIPRLIKTFVR